MLLELRAENYAVIDRAIASFGPGLNLLSGETGAGKSILVDALTLLLGGKASSDAIRHGAERAIVACVFQSASGAEAILSSNGIDSEGDEIILRREILPNGKGRVYINNQPATVAVLRQLAPELALVHTQSETLAGFNQSQQRLLLDRFAALDSESVSAAYDRWSLACAELSRFENAESDHERQAGDWTFTLQEIGGARIQPAQEGKFEDEVLAAEHRVLANAEKIYAAAMAAHEILYEGAASAEAALRAGLRHVEDLARYDGRFVESADTLRSARAIVADLGATVRDYADNVQASPERLAEIDERLALLDRLKRKYQRNLPEILAYGEEVRGRLAALENREQRLEELRSACGQAAAHYREEALRLTSQRQSAAAKLAKLAHAEIQDLALKASFSIEVQPRQEEIHWSREGWDLIECLIATNAGEPMKRLDEIASGGEMSRVMLALKVSVEEGASKRKRGGEPLPRTLVFDEIDIGIGGRAAEAVGKKLQSLARGQQVLCVTHLPQIAAFAGQHFVVEKRERQGQTKTSIRLLDKAGRIEEIARMLSGAKLTGASLLHAEQMIKISQNSGGGQGGKSS